MYSSEPYGADSFVEAANAQKSGLPKPHSFMKGSSKEGRFLKDWHDRDTGTEVSLMPDLQFPPKIIRCKVTIEIGLGPTLFLKSTLILFFPAC